jgi:O-succinylbenzoic acid--CoA ligase
LVLGSPVVVHGSFDVAAFTRPDASCTSLVPTMLTRLLSAGVNLAHFRAILVGGAELDEPSRGRPVVSTYGMTESCGGVVYDGTPLDGVEMQIGADDEVQLRGPMMMRGYRLSDEQPVTADGWLRTRDAGVISDGVLRVLGRLDDVIITGGEKVWPSEVEGVLRAHPAVADVAVVGTRDAEWGARVTAIVVASDPSDPPTLEAVRAFCRDRIASYKAPRALELRDALPRTSSGKISRSALYS